MTDSNTKPTLKQRLDKELEISEQSRELVEKEREEALQSMSNDDFEKARESFKKLIDMGFASLEDMQTLAQDSEHPRMFEVMAKMMDSVRQSSTDLMEASKKKQEFDKNNSTKSEAEKQNNSSNVTFIGTTDEIISKIMNNKKKSNEQAVDAEFTTDKDQ